MVRGSRPSSKSRASSVSKHARSVQSKTRTSRSSSTGVRVKGATVNSKYKNIERKTGTARHLSTKKSRSSKISGAQAYRQKKKIEAKAENVAIRHFRGKGYQTYRMQHNRSGHGVDLGVIQRDRRGQIRQAGVVEIKGSGVRTPSISAFKKQVRRSYYMPRLKKAKDRGKAGASDLYALAKKKSPKLQSMAVTSGPQGNRLYKIPPTGKISRKYQSI